MKLWHKFFISNLIILGIMFNLASYLLLEKSNYISIKREADRALLEHKNMYISLKIMDENVWMDINDSSSYKEFMIQRWMQNFDDKNIKFEILDNKKKEVVSNFNFKNLQSRKELNNLKLKKRNYILRKVDSRMFIFVSSLINLKNKTYILSCAKDVQSLYNQNEVQKKYLFQLNFGIMLCLFFANYFIIKVILNPIQTLIHSTNKIAKGDFSQKIEIKNKDEISILIKNFNEMSQALEENFLKMQEMFEQKNRFIQNFTHEIKTPLTSIVGYADFLRRIDFNKKIFSKSLNHIYNEGKRLEILRNKMMNLILNENKKLQFKNSFVKKAIKESVLLMKIPIENKKLKVNIDGDDFEVLMEEELFKIMITNILDNAVKASFENSVILINIVSKNRLIKIKDFGVGISKEQLEKIKEPFYIGDSSRQKKDLSGFGLGLSIVDQIILLHNAKLIIKSEKNEGCCVEIIF